MDQQHNQPHISQPRRNFMRGAAAAAGAAALTHPLSVLAQGAYDGKQYCMPDFVSTVVVAYRKDLFAAAGLSEPKTLDDVLAAAVVLTGCDQKKPAADTSQPGAPAASAAKGTIGVSLLTLDNPFFKVIVEARKQRDNVGAQRNDDVAVEFAHRVVECFAQVKQILLSGELNIGVGPHSRGCVVNGANAITFNVIPFE